MKKQLQIALKFIKWLLIGIFCPILLYIVTGLILTIIPTNPKTLDCKTDKQVHFETSPIHVDMVLPIEVIDSSILKGLSIPANTKYIGFGWGDEAFYLKTKTWADLSIVTALKSLLIKTPSAMHVTYHRSFRKDWSTKNICLEQAKSINIHILSGFKLNDGRLISIKNT